MLGLCLGLLLASVAWGQAASPEYQILLDTDDNPATGCTVATSQGDVLGIDQRLVVTVTIGTTTATVSGIQLQNCVNGTFGAAVWTNPGGWLVGLGNGTDGAAVIEAFLPLAQLSGTGPVRVGVISTAGQTRDALLVTGGGQPSILLRGNGAGGDATAIPVLNPLTLALLAALLGGALRYGRRWPKATQLLVLVVALAGAGLVWAALVRDGQTSDWAGVPPLATQSSAVTGPAQLVALYGKVDGGNVNFRIDAGITINQTPQVDAGTDQTVTLPASASLNGNVTDDGLPNPPGTVTVTWSQDSGPGTVTFGSANTQATTATFSTAGSYVLRLTADDGEKSAFDTVMVTVNSAGGGGSNQAPQVDAGTDQTITLPADANLSGNVTDDGLPNPPGTVTITWSMDSGPGTVTFGNAHAASTTATFSTDGVYVLRLTANDGALPASDTVQVTVNPASSGGGNQAPQVSAGNSQTITLPDSANLDGTVTDDGLPNPPGAVTVTWSMDSGPGTVTFGDAAQQDTTASFSTAGVYVLRLTADDGALTEFATVTITVNPEPVSSLPPDPKTVAPKINATVATTVFAATEFLYTGTDPIQTGVAPGTIDPKRAAVLRGRVLDKQNNPLSGVTLTVLNHPEFGQTLSRADGWFDLVVNGGGYLTLNYQKTGYLPAQRQANVPWQDYRIADDIVMIGLDPQVTSINLGASQPMQVARGSLETDADGPRQATMFFPEGVQATMTLPDGSTQPLTSLQVRATEYTVGENGPETMPAELPPTSGYTYAVELSVDEALAAGATRVDFDQPLPFYVENFTDFPVGGIVPVGWYNRVKAAWIPSDNGRIIAILSVDSSGLAVLDVDGTGNPANASALAELGITDTERQQLASLYTPGQSLWRTPITHFTPIDCNWPYRPPQDAEEPPNEKPKSSDALDCGPCGCDALSGCVIEAQSQTLGEEIPVIGTPFNLHYRSNRVPGYLAERTIQISVTQTIPASLRDIVLTISVAGQVHQETILPAPNISRTFVWDGLDAYGRPYQGTADAQVNICFEYPAVPVSPSELSSSFAQLSDDGISITGNRATNSFSSCKDWILPIKNSVPTRSGLGGWSLSPQHAYDPVGGVLHLGSGGQRSTAATLYNIISTVAGNGIAGSGGDGGLAIDAHLVSLKSVEVDSDGSLYILDGNRVRRVNRDGIIATVAGNDGSLNDPTDIALTPDGNLYIADTGNLRVLRLDPDGSITTVAGNGALGFSGDGGPATEASLFAPSGIAVGNDGSFYIADYGNRRVRRVDPNGIITTVAGNGTSGFSGDDGLATDASLRPLDVAVDTDGSLYVADNSNYRVRRIDPTGIITTVAGNGAFGFSGDGGPATAASLDPADIALGPGGDIYIADRNNYRVRRIGRDGIITTVAGNGLVVAAGSIGDGSPATSVRVIPSAVAVAPDGSIYVGDSNIWRVRRVSPSLPEFDLANYLISSEDGGQLYLFNASGRHLQTLDAITGTPIYTFAYDANGLLISVTDLDGDVTTIERSGDGTPLAIVAPDGQRTALTLNAEGYLASVTNPAGETHAMQYTPGGLMTEYIDPRSNPDRFQYDSLGRLVKNTNAIGGGWTLTHTDTANGYTNTLTSGEGRSSDFSVEMLTTGDRLQTNAYPDGTVQERLFKTNGEEITTASDGTVTTLKEGPDPRFGMQAPVPVSLKIDTAGGLSLNATGNRTADLTDENDPFSLTNLTETFTVNGRTYSRVYDAASRTYTGTTPAGRQSTAIVDEKRRPLSIKTADLNAIDVTYDARGRLRTLSEGEGVEARVTTLTYHNSGPQQGYLASISDAENRAVAFEYDAAGRVTQQTLPDGRQIQFAYDANGNLTSLTPPGRPAHQFTYTTVDQTQAYIPPTVSNGGNTAYEYDRDKALTKVTRPDGLVLNYSYDNAGRLTRLATPEGNSDYSYDAATGNLAGITAPGGEGLAYTYDGALLTQASATGTINGNVAYSYDNNFRVASINLNGSDPITYSYDADSLLTQVGSAAAGNYTLSRNAQNGLLTGTILGSLNDSYTYNGFAEMTGYLARFNTTDLFRTDFTRDKLGRITRKVEIIGGVTSTYDYTYDTAGRLVEVQLNGAVQESYGYDANGNRTHLNGSEIAHYDDQDRLLDYNGATYAYTANGELTSKTEGSTTTTYRYDVLGNLREVTLPDGTQIEYVIDGQNRRIGKKRDGVLEQGFIYQSQLRPAAELNGSGSIVSRFVYATGVNVPDFMVKGGVTYRIIKDHLGSPRLVVDVATNTVAQRMDYDTWGNVVLDTNPGFQPFGFAGGIYDRDTGLVRFGVRDYDSEVGRWIAKDPINFVGGAASLYSYFSGYDSGMERRAGVGPIGFERDDANLYRYTFNSPQTFVDPDGQAVLQLCLIAVTIYKVPDIFEKYLACKGAIEERDIFKRVCDTANKAGVDSHGACSRAQSMNAQVGRECTVLGATVPGTSSNPPIFTTPRM